MRTINKMVIQPNTPNDNKVLWLNKNNASYYNNGTWVTIGESSEDMRELEEKVDSLDVDMQTVENEIQDINSRHNTLNTKHESLSKTVQGIAATGGASTATNVTYDNNASGLNAENAQDAIDELSSIGHFVKRGGVVNISTNYNSEHTVEVLTLSQAIAKVPSSDRVLGFTMTFLSSDGWKNYQFTGATINNWTDINNWNSFVNDAQLKSNQDSIIEKLNTKVNTSDIVQQTGNSIISVMSQKAVSDKLAKKADSEQVNNSLYNLEKKIGDRFVIEGDVTNLPDEEDLTSVKESERDVLKLADRSYDPYNFSGKGYKILRRNIKQVSIAVTKISVESAPSSDGTLSFTINGKETQVAVSATTDNTTALVAQKVAVALQDLMTEYDVSIDVSLITLTRKSGGSVTPSVFSASTTGVVCTVTDSTNRKLINILTPAMINQSNTIYEIRYDFDLNGATINIPDNCILKFKGGIISNGTINGNNANIVNNYSYKALVNIKYNSPAFFNKNSTYYIIPEIWGINEGYIEKDTDGHYSDKKYDIMYNNGVGFTKAIEYAYEHGFNKVIFPKGKYCFTPFDGDTKNRLTYNIWIHDLYNVDIDLNSSELYLIVDDTQKSKYVTFDYGNIYDIRGGLIGVTACENIFIHNGTLVGDRFIRSYKDNHSKWSEDTYGIHVYGININIKISDIDASNFMGDGIASNMSNFIYTDYKQKAYYKSTENITRKKGTLKTDLSLIDVEGTSLSDFIDTDTLYTDTYLKTPLLKRYYKHFRIIGSGSYTRLANCYCPKIDVAVYDGNTKDSKVTRTISCSFLEDFHLYKNERYIKLCFFEDFDIPDEGIQSNLVITVKGAEGLLIEHCHIHDNHRGGFSGSINNTTISKCVFRKDYTSNTIEVPDYPDATNYFIDIEDSFCKKITVCDCDFIGRASSELLFGCYDLEFFNNRSNQEPSIYNCIIANIHNNIFKKGNVYGSISGWAVNENSVGGIKHMKRKINIYNNYIYDVKVNSHVLSSLINTYITSYNNEYHLQTTLNNINDNIIYSSKYVFQNKSIKVYDNTIYIDADNYIYFCIVGIWNNNKILNNIGKTYDRYKKIYIAGIINNNIFEVTDTEIVFGEISNTTFDRTISYFLTGHWKADVRKIKFNNVTINNFVCSHPLPNDFIVEFNNCTFKFIKGNSALLACSNTTLLFNTCNFITDNNILIPYRVFNNSSNNVKLILKDCLYNGNPIDNTVRLSDIEKKIVCIKRGSTEERPFYVEDDFVYYDTTLNKYIRWNGNIWVNLDGTELAQ